MSPTHSREARQPCPDLPKGARCPLCGGCYVCLDWKTRSKSLPAADLTLARSIAGEDRDQLQRGMDERQEQR